MAKFWALATLDRSWYLLSFSRLVGRLGHCGAHMIILSTSLHHKHLLVLNIFNTQFSLNLSSAVFVPWLFRDTGSGHAATQCEAHSARGMLGSYNYLMFPQHHRNFPSRTPSHICILNRTVPYVLFFCTCGFLAHT